VSARDGGTRPASQIPGVITTVHQYELPLARQEVWGLISEVSEYRTWWPWLRRFEGAALASDEVWRCEVQPPVPYLVRFRVAIEDVEPAALVRAKVSGDVVGVATLTLSDTDAGCTATLDSSLAPGNRGLRLVSRLAAPIARFGHDWVLDSGARQFITRAVEPLVGD
jgi:hypothetical protein